MGRSQRLGEMLVQKGTLTGDQVRIALIEQQHSGAPLGRVLVSLGFVSEAVVRDALGEALDQRSVNLASLLPDPEAIARVPLAIARRFHVVPVAWEGRDRTLALAMSDTLDVVVLDQVTALLGGATVRPLLAGEAEISRAIDRFYGFALSIDGILQELETGKVDPAAVPGDEGNGHPVVRLVNALISDAVKHGASDLHLEPEHRFLRIRYRIDGVLRPVRSLHAKYWPAMAVRLKVMAALNIAETRAPQDGRLTLALHGREVDFRLSCLPTLHGENLVLRVLDRHQGSLPLEQLGLTDENLRTLQVMMARPEGLILVTGPTGSGKTTTLYSILNAINTERVNIMTLEDPVEYPMSGIRQSMVNESARLDFANGVRAMLRQDPDVILIGEIRDPETADMALRAAMTGHQVYATLHTHSAIGAIPRLLDLGVRAEVLAGNVIGVVAQRLVRRLCPHCREPYRPTPPELQRLALSAQAPTTLWRAVGCDQCDRQGYRGRHALMEVLRFDDELDELVTRRATGRELKAEALRRGFRTLAEDGSRRVAEGTTSLDELSRVVDLTSRVL
jgi:general secretion pathway protein E/type IV pilus assembly protein PilB